MKKTIVILTALAALCSLVSCEEKNEDSKGNTEIIQSEETTEAEMPFREYKAEDFTDINVKLNKQQTAPPVELKEYDLSWIELEPRVSVCALPENRDISKIVPFYISDAANYDMTPEEYTEEFMKLYEPLLDKPVHPSIEKTAFDGEYIYYVVKYDKCCYINYHDFEIYRCNPETKENECIFSYSDPDMSFTVYDMTYFNDELWIMGEYDKPSDYVTVNSSGISAEGHNKSEESSDEPLEGIFRADKETNTLELSFSPPDDSWHIQGFYRTDDNRLVTSYVQYTGENSEIWFYEYNGNSWEKGEYKKYGISIPYNGEFVTSYEKNKTLFTECSRFSLDTGLRSSVSHVVAISDKMATYMVTDSLSTILYTYDFEKMERYIIDLTSFGQYYAYYSAGDNIILHQTTGDYGMYIIPELGAAFELFKGELTTTYDINNGEIDTSYCIYSANGKIAITEENTINRVHYINGDISANIPEKSEYIGENMDCISKVIILSE